MNAIITVDSLEKSFGKYRVIDNLSLEIEPGTVYGLVGLNGAGKTTLLRLLLGILKPDRGIISILGATPWKHTATFYRQCGVVLENDGFWGNLTVEENCVVYAGAKGISKKELHAYLDEHWRTTALFNNKKVKTLSRGQRMQCALCRAFMGSPSVIFLDEPVIALDLNAYGHFKDLVRQARMRGASLIISSHQFDTIDEVCDRVGILSEGCIREIPAKSGTDVTEWFIDMEYYAEATHIVIKAGGTDIRFENGLYFSLQHATTEIPHIIAELVTAGCTLREVRRQENAFSATIRTFYSSSNGKKQ